MSGKIGIFEPELAAQLESLRNSVEIIEARFREWREFSRLMLETCPIGMGVMRPDDLRFLVANPAFCSLLAYPPEELLKLTLQDVLHSGDARDCHTELADGRVAKPPPFTTRLITKTGEPRMARLCFVGAYDCRGMLQRILLFADRPTDQEVLAQCAQENLDVIVAEEDRVASLLDELRRLQQLVRENNRSLTAVLRTNLGDVIDILRDVEQDSSLLSGEQRRKCQMALQRFRDVQRSLNA